MERIFDQCDQCGVIEMCYLVDGEPLCGACYDYYFGEHWALGDCTPPEWYEPDDDGMEAE